MVREKKEKKKQFNNTIIMNIFPIVENYDELVRQSYERLKNGERMQIAPNINLVRLLMYGKDFKPYLSLDLRAIVPTKEYSYRNPLNIRDLQQFEVVHTLINIPYLKNIVKAVDMLNSEIKCHNDMIVEQKKEKVKQNSKDSSN